MKLKIKNKFKFIISSSILLIAILFIVLSSVNKTFSHTDIQYKEVSVIAGQTLWSIASNEKLQNEYYNNKDIRYIVYDIKKHNNLTQSYISEGEVLNIPTY